MNLFLIAISGSICLLQIGNGAVSLALAFRSPNIWLGSDTERRLIVNKSFTHQPTILHQRQINYAITQTTNRRHSSILSNPSGSRSVSPLFMADTSDNVEPLITNDVELLTPETYANVESAENQVEEVIGTKASEAFKSTNFDNEPKLSPELDGCSLDFDELIDNTAVSTKADAFQRKLLEERLANNRSKDVKKSEGEAFQRSLLSARIANDTKVKLLSSIGELQQKDDNNLESKALYASKSDSGTEELQQHNNDINLNSEVVVETVAVEVAEAKQDELITDIVGEGNQMAAQLMKAAMEQEMRDAQARAAAEEKKRKLEEQEKRKYLNDAPAVQQVQQPVALSGINQWRKNDYVDEVRQAMYHNAMAKTKARLSSKNKSVRDTDREYESTISTVDEVVEPLTSTAAAAVTTSSKHTEERDMKQDLVFEVFGKRVRQRRSYVVIALAVVACRRFFLAFFGYSMRLI